jgi:iron uptake system EfeUOB component EfeO/EfeM
MAHHPRAVVTLLGAAAIVLMAGCGASSPSTPTGPAGSTPSGGGAVNPSAPAVRQVHVSISDAGCGPQTLSLPAGPATFIVTNTGSGSVLEYEIEQSGRIIGEVENVIPGIDRSFTLNLKPGAYILNCPGGTTAATGTLTVTE